MKFKGDTDFLAILSSFRKKRFRVLSSNLFFFNLYDDEIFNFYFEREFEVHEYFNSVTQRFKGGVRVQPAVSKCKSENTYVMI